MSDLFAALTEDERSLIAPDLPTVYCRRANESIVIGWW